HHAHSRPIGGVLSDVVGRAVVVHRLGGSYIRDGNSEVLRGGLPAIVIVGPNGDRLGRIAIHKSGIGSRHDAGRAVDLEPPGCIVGQDIRDGVVGNVG